MDAFEMGRITAAERLETFCALVILLLMLAMFADDPRSIGVRERIDPLHSRLVVMIPSVREYYDGEHPTATTQKDFTTSSSDT